MSKLEQIKHELDKHQYKHKETMDIVNKALKEVKDHCNMISNMKTAINHNTRSNIASLINQFR